MHLKLTIQVDRVLYSALAQPDVAAAADPLAANGGSTAAAASSGTAGTTTLHVSGKVTSENEHVKKGAFHTLDLEIGRDFTIIKGEGEWDSVARERIKEMTEPGRGADVGAIVCGEGESATSSSRAFASASYPAAVSRSDNVRLLCRSGQHLHHHEPHDDRPAANRRARPAETERRRHRARCRSSGTIFLWASRQSCMTDEKPVGCRRTPSSSCRSTMP